MHTRTVTVKVLITYTLSFNDPRVQFEDENRVL